ncbi:MAG: hypothetical protein WCG87_12040 [Bacteroidota bacterium]
MNIYIRYSIVCVLLISSFSGYAQKNTSGIYSNKPTRPKPPKPLRSEFSLGIRLNTDGWGVILDKGVVKPKNSKYGDMYYDVKLYEFELSEHKSPKETKITNTNGALGTDNPTPYIYGKINNFYTIKFGLGNRKMIAGKPEAGTVSIHWLYMGGISVGLLKPYYINTYMSYDSSINATDPPGKQTIKYNPATHDAFLSLGKYEFNAIGAAGFSKGLNEIKIVPGIFFKTGLHFDFATTRRMKLAVETGAIAELYTQKIQIMANDEAVPYFLGMYLGIQFGKRW